MSTYPARLTLGIELIDDACWMGGTLYLRNLVLCLARLPEAERPWVRLIGPSAVVQRFLDEWGYLPVFESVRPPGMLWRIRRRLGLVGRARQTAPAIVYPGFGAPVPGAVTIRWIPDFQHVRLPHLFQADELAARDRSIRDIAMQQGVVVLSSEVSRADFRAFCPDYAATPRVWHFCSMIDTSAPPAIAPQQTFGLPEKYLYLPNQFWAHKNHITALRALARLKREYGLAIPLVCTGAQSDRRNEAHMASLLSFIDSEGLTGQVHLLGLLDRTDQTAVLRCAAAIVQPSLFEGWSTVVEDVRATGRPIFLSDIPVHREQAPQHCTYFAPESDAQLAAAVAAAWPMLSPGPDAAAEAAARQNVEQRILASARGFCDIARAALEIGTAE